MLEQNMNFRPTFWKLIISLALGIIADYFFAVGSIKASCSCAIGVLCNCLQINWLMYVFNTVPIIAFFIGVIFVYIIWSLIQKREKNVG